jgi:hypothetical protein
MHLVVPFDGPASWKAPRESGLWFKIRYLFFPLLEALREMNDDIHDRFGRALERGDDRLHFGRIHGGNGTARKVSPDWVYRRLVRFWVQHGVALFPLCAADAIMHNVRRCIGIWALI